MRRFSFLPPVKIREPAELVPRLKRMAQVRNQGADVLPSVTRIGGNAWPYRLIYLAIAVQVVNMLLAMYMTNSLSFGDVLLDIFGSWDLALTSKCLAFAFWILLRGRPAARLAAWVIAPLSVLALLHDVLLLILP